MFITNNYASFHLRSKENLFKQQNVSKYYDHNCGFCKFISNVNHTKKQTLVVLGLLHTLKLVGYQATTESDKQNTFLKLSGFQWNYPFLHNKQNKSWKISAYSFIKAKYEQIIYLN